MLMNTRQSVSPFLALQKELDRFVGAFDELRRPAFPPLNLWEHGEALVAEAELPGFKFEDIEIYVEGRDLTIEGRREQRSEDGATYLRQERGYGKFTRKLRLPVDIDSEQVKANLKDGVLRITLPKAEAARARRIEVQPG